MRVSLIKTKKIEDIILPIKHDGSYWISDTDSNGIKKNLISIEPYEHNWRMTSNKEVYCIENNMIKPYFDLEEYHFYTLENSKEKNNILLYCSPVEQQYNYYNISNLLDKGITVGGGKKDVIYYQILEESSAKLILENGKVYIVDNNSKYGVFVNKVRITNRKELKIGDVVFIMGLQFFYISQHSGQVNNIYLCVNNKNLSSILVNNIPPVNLVYNNSDFTEETEEYDIPVYEESDYFYRTPRYINHLETLHVNLDAPPAKIDNQEQSALLTIGPMVTMSMTSMITGFTAVNSLTSGDTTLSRALPSLVMSGAMIASTLIWPTVSRRYQKSQTKKKEKLRQKKYSAYIEEKRNLIISTKRQQTEILKNSFPDTNYCQEMILNRYTNLWQKRIEDEDYLKINLGTGDFPAAIEIQYPEEHFSLMEDNLKELLNKVGSEPRVLTGVPIVLPLLKDYICGFIGEEGLVGEFLRRMLIQILAFHSYEDLKIVVLTDEEKEYQWKFLKDCPHCFTDDKSLRFFATNNDEYKEVCYYLSRVFNSRKDAFKENQPNIESLDKIYLIITDSFKKVRDFDVLDDILETKYNYGFCLAIVDHKMTNLPEQCKDFVSVLGETGELHNDENFINGIKFNIDFNSDIRYENCAKKLANIPIEIDSDDEGQLPNKIGFLEMYDVGKIEQLNSLSRWKNNNPILNLSVPVGIGKSGEMINIDLHEKYHGPHGLIAGMTGSGKSEFIITYILSMAVNYHPYEVQFILIDYKGGGLAGAFENKNTGLKLPHLVGTITNLDANEINRSLASIESELKRRQAIFNKAREISGESTIDIYKYQKMYRDGKVEEPVSHLFIISDEFAELKNQQPEFMEQLISTARIGRSLGVHLILATQKPSGVVDAQIWSNTRFRVCMRVQEKSDSNEVIKCPDAAFLKQTGRFYFQVGYNEIFVLGQASYAGGKYVPEEKVKKTLDTSINFINNINYVIKNVETKEKQEKVVSHGEELSNIVKYLNNLAKQEKIKCRPLWLEKIPSDIRVENLAEKYSYEKQNFVISPIIGEYDIPWMQEQKLLTLPISEVGNSLVYGASGSGKENFITTLIYSSMLYYSVDELNYYIIDFGSGTLKPFRKCPLVGDILSSDEEDKIINLYKMINKKIEERKELFVDYNGDYYNYCQNSGSTLPTIVVIINNFESYYETYSELEDELITLSREASKYGIYFVITLNTPNGMRFKMKQNFGFSYVLQQNDEDDYVAILGNVNRKYPAKIFGRGIIKEGNDVYEFQTALVTERNEISQFIKEKCQEFADNATKKAPSVPVLPKTVTNRDVEESLKSTDNIIIGLDKTTLDIVEMDFMKKYFTMITSLDLNQTANLVNPMISQIINKKDIDLIVINAEEYLIDLKDRDNYEYIEKDFDELIERLYEAAGEQYEIYKNNNYDRKSLSSIKDKYCIIVGIESLKNRLSADNKTKLNEMFTKYKGLDTICFIVVDTVDKIKKNEYENWYKECVDNTSGIWVGNGINDQFVLKTNQRTEDMKKDIPYNFCFVVNKGRPYYVKYIEKFDLSVENIINEKSVEMIEEIDI